MDNKATAVIESQFFAGIRCASFPRRFVVIPGSNQPRFLNENRELRFSLKTSVVHSHFGELNRQFNCYCVHFDSPSVISQSLSLTLTAFILPSLINLRMY
jgi:hypothetical protein